MNVHTLSQRPAPPNGIACASDGELRDDLDQIRDLLRLTSMALTQVDDNCAEAIQAGMNSIRAIVDRIDDEIALRAEATH